MKIDKHIPMPPKSTLPVRKAALLKMAVGDSILFKDVNTVEDYQKVVNSYWNPAKRLGITISARRTGPTEMRIWRIK